VTRIKNITNKNDEEEAVSCPVCDRTCETGVVAISKSAKR